MKIVRLSATEVANTSVLSIEKRRAKLLSIEDPKVFWNYRPLTDALPKLLLAEAPLFEDLPSGKDSELVAQIKSSCKSSKNQKNACVASAEAIIKWRNENAVTGRIVYTDPLRLTVDTLKYCSDVVAIMNDTPYVINLDPRSTMSLSVEGKEFIKSLIHHTALIGDLRGAKAGILRTPKVGHGERKAIFEPLLDEPRFSLEDIIKRVNETYSIWETILRARKAGKATEEK